MPRLGIDRLLFAVSYLLLCSFVLVHAQLLPPLPASGSDAAANALTRHMSYCSECYPTDAARLALCHRLALSKFFLAECTQTNDAPCIGTATQGISASFGELNDPVSDPRVGLAETLQCRLFSTQFITENNSVLQDSFDEKVTADSLADRFVDELRAKLDEIFELPPLPGEEFIESIVAEVIYSKSRQSGIPERIPDLSPLAAQLIVDPVTRLGNSTAMPSTVDHIDLHDDERADGAAFAVSLAHNLGLSPMLATDASLGDNPFGLDPFTKLASSGAEAVGAATQADGPVLPVVVRQRFPRRPRATKITIQFARNVRYGPVSLAFRLLLRQNYVLRTYRSGSWITRVNKRKYHFYAYFIENYNRVYGSLRPSFEARF